MFHLNSRIHADGDNKNNLYFNDLLPERFGRKDSMHRKTSEQNQRKKPSGIRLKTKSRRFKLVTNVLLMEIKKKRLQEDLHILFLITQPNI
jgi:D-citramalate synthase